MILQGQVRGGAHAAGASPPRAPRQAVAAAGGAPRWPPPLSFSLCLLISPSLSLSVSLSLSISLCLFPSLSLCLSVSLFLSFSLLLVNGLRTNLREACDGRTFGRSCAFVSNGIPPRENNDGRVLLSFQQPTLQTFTDIQRLSHSLFKLLSLKCRLLQ